MRHFNKQLVANSAMHAQWWGETSALRVHFHQMEEQNEGLMRMALGNSTAINAASLLPTDAWREVDALTARIVRADDGRGLMADLMPLAKAVNIGKLVHLSRVSSDLSDEVVVSMSGQVPVPLDKVTYDHRGAPVPIFAKGYGREWREWNTLQSEGFDALADDQEATLHKLLKAQADYVLNGNAKINVGGYQGYGIMNHPLTKKINLGTAGGNTAIDLTTADGDALDAFFSGPFGLMLDTNEITDSVNLYISRDIARAWDKSYSGASGYKGGRIVDFLNTNRRINKIAVDTRLVGNQFYGFVPDSRFIRPLVGMAVNVTAKARMNPTDNYQFLAMGAMGIDIRGDYAGMSGVFASTVLNG